MVLRWRKVFSQLMDALFVHGSPLQPLHILVTDYRAYLIRHGACFNACTGDIEDAPALFAIHSFKTQVEGDKILVTADPKLTKKDDNLVRQPNIATNLNREESSGVVIVGGGSGTMHAIESLREVRIGSLSNSIIVTHMYSEWFHGSNHCADEGALSPD
jgi:hypothetical protein